MTATETIYMRDSRYGDVYAVRFIAGTDCAIGMSIALTEQEVSEHPADEIQIYEKDVAWYDAHKADFRPLF